MGILYIIATPIGNLGDITLRALETLKAVDAILCEDTRRTKILLDHYNIKKPLISYHQHSRLTKIDLVIKKLKNGEKLALVSDAGTPGISDPGNELIGQIVKLSDGQIEIIPIPGPSAITAALSVSGFDCSKFLFLGFLPKKKGRQTILHNLARDPFDNLTIIFYESPFRIGKTLGELIGFFGEERKAVVMRELTKKFEEIKRGSLKSLAKYFLLKKFKGEFVVVINKK